MWNISVMYLLTLFLLLHIRLKVVAQLVSPLGACTGLVGWNIWLVIAMVLWLDRCNIFSFVGVVGAETVMTALRNTTDENFPFKQTFSPQEALSYPLTCCSGPLQLGCVS